MRQQVNPQPRYCIYVPAFRGLRGHLSAPPRPLVLPFLPSDPGTQSSSLSASQLSPDLKPAVFRQRGSTEAFAHSFPSVTPPAKKKKDSDSPVHTWQHTHLAKRSFAQNVTLPCPPARPPQPPLPHSRAAGTRRRRWIPPSEH